MSIEIIDPMPSPSELQEGTSTDEAEMLPVEVTSQELQDTLADLITTYTSDSKETANRRRGKLRGALIPIGAGLLGTGVHLFASTNIGKAIDIANNYDIFGGSDGGSKALDTLLEIVPVLDKFGPIGIASVAATVGSASASAFRRAFGESLFSYYSRYSHFESKALHPTKKITSKLFNWYARGLEHTAFNTLVNNPAKKSFTVSRLVQVAEDPAEIDALTEKQKIYLLSKGMFHILSGEATKYFGAEFSKAELEAIQQTSTEIHSAIESVLETIPASERQRVLEIVQKKVASDEKVRYWMSVGIMSSISGVKAFGLGKLFAGIMQLIPPLFNISSQPTVQAQELTASQPVTAAQNLPAAHGLPETQIAPVTQGLPEMQNLPATQVLPEAQLMSPVVRNWLGLAGKPQTALSESPDVARSVAETASRMHETAPKPLAKSFEALRRIFASNANTLDVSTLAESPVSQSPISQSPVWETPGAWSFSRDVTMPSPEVPATASVGIETAIPPLAATEAPSRVAELPFKPWESITDLRATDALTAQPLADLPNALPKVELPPPATIHFDLDLDLNALPEISGSDILANTIQSSVESTITIDEAIQILTEVSVENPEQLMNAIGQAQQDPVFVESYVPLVPVGASAPEVISAIQSAGPSALYVLNKLLQLAACAGSLTTGGAACPRLAGP